MFGEPPLPLGLIRRALDEEWSLAVEAVEYLAVGYGSFHWRSSDPDDWLVTADSALPDTVVPQAYRLARQLRGDGLEFVRAPLPHRGDDVVWESNGWWLSVWPWLEGRTSPGTEHASAADLRATLGCVRKLHDHAGAAPVAELVEDWSIPQRAELVGLLEDWSSPSGPYADEVGSLLLGNEEAVYGLMDRYDGLTASITARDVRHVITHGEPHAKNVVHTRKGPMLIDWDTVRWAPRERDLWSFPDRRSWSDGYGADVEIDDDIIETYRLQWALVEIADFATSLTAAATRTPDLEVAMRELNKYLRAAES